MNEYQDEFGNDQEDDGVEEMTLDIESANENDEIYFPEDVENEEPTQQEDNEGMNDILEDVEAEESEMQEATDEGDMDDIPENVEHERTDEEQKSADFSKLKTLGSAAGAAAGIASALFSPVVDVPREQYTVPTSDTEIVRVIEDDQLEEKSKQEKLNEEYLKYDFYKKQNGEEVMTAENEAPAGGTPPDDNSPDYEIEMDEDGVPTITVYPKDFE